LSVGMFASKNKALRVEVNKIINLILSIKRVS
jgi:hypothetical protein